MQYGDIRHGEAVGLGLLAAVRLAARRGRASAEYAQQTRRLLEWAALPVALPEVNRDALRAAMALDKKRRSGKLTFVLPVEPGRVDLIDDVGADELIDTASE